jgi:hypothetical protein
MFQPLENARLKAFERRPRRPDNHRDWRGPQNMFKQLRFEGPLIDNGFFN